MKEKYSKSIAVYIFLIALQYAAISGQLCDEKLRVVPLKDPVIANIHDEYANISVVVNQPPENITVEISGGTEFEVLDPSPDNSSVYTYIRDLEYHVSISQLYLFRTNSTCGDAVDTRVMFYVHVDTEIVSTETVVLYALENTKDLYLECSALGNPPPGFRWVKRNDLANTWQEDLDIPLPVSIDDVTAESRLHFGDDQDGIEYENNGVYTCQAENLIGENDQVETKDEFNYIVEVQVPIEIAKQTDIEEAKEGEDIKLTCDFRGFPLPETEDLFWNVTGERYVTEVTYESDQEVSLTLTIDVMRCDDEREFTCIGRNYVLNELLPREVIGTVILTIEELSELRDLVPHPEECDGTMALVTWSLPSSWDEVPLKFEVYVDDAFYTNVTSYEVTLVGLEPYSSHTVMVIGSTCDKRGPASSAQFQTGVSIPSEPNDVTMSTFQNGECNVAWNLPNVTYNNITKYRVYVESRPKSNSTEDWESWEYFDAPRDSLDYSFSPNGANTEYKASVSAFTCAGEGERLAQWNEACVSDTGAPPEINSPDVSSNVTSAVDPNGFELEIPDSSEENGNISCYFVIMVRRNISEGAEVNGSEVVIDPNNLTSYAEASYQDVKDETPYVTLASNSPGGVTVGNNSQSACDIYYAGKFISQRETSDTIQALNRNLSPQRNYSVFILVTVPSIYETNKDYRSVSEPTYIAVGAEGVKDDFPLILVVCVVVLALLILAILVFVLYRCERKRRTVKKIDRVIQEKDAEVLPNYNAVESQLELIEENNFEANTEFDTIASSSGEIIDGRRTTFIPKNEIVTELYKRCEDDDKLFKEELENIPVQTSAPVSVSQLPENATKNRYKDIKSYDRTRVKLRRPEGSEESDYINASMIDGYKTKNKFIATQGPKENTLEDFWRMIHDNHTSTIVMLSRLVEMGRKKCDIYWPEKVNESETYGRYRITLESETKFQNYVTRRLLVTKLDSLEMENNLEVTQFQYISWPDHDVPEETAAFLEFYKQIIKGEIIQDGPIVVHCSAGVGRTGTFIALNILLEQLKEENGVDLISTIKKIREQRPHMIQTATQYKFCFSGICDTIKSENWNSSDQATDDFAF